MNGASGFNGESERSGGVNGARVQKNFESYKDIRFASPLMHPLRLGLPFTSPLHSDSPLKTRLNPETLFIYPFPLPSPEFISVPTFVSDYCHRLYLRSVRCHSGSSTAPFLFLRLTFR
ncbi:hypothetical protein BpHYR1_011307 [Brachionus plicatilis]|uniref:Uncharacterized protein n=1 Tax=Brachionus plicatilis TaxID=10195 RepID=A0A3M7S0Z8_BRAPC|nr:hypothetical protein BpHYR1_011307 [Brachionus plicatilis]